MHSRQASVRFLRRPGTAPRSRSGPRIRRSWTTIRNTLRSCLLYSWIRLTWLSKIVSGSTVSRISPSKRPRKLPLPEAMPFESIEKARVVHQRLEPAKFGEVGNPCVSNCSRDQVRERAAGQEKPAPGCHPICLIAEPFGKHLREILDGRHLSRRGMDLRDAIAAVRSHD